MNILLGFAFRLSKGANVFGGIILTLMMLITVTDVILRSFGKPIVGAYELVGFSGALVLGFSIPFTSWVRGHIYVDILVQRLPQKGKMGFHVATRGLAIGLFLMTGWNLVKMGGDLLKSGEVSPTLQVPFYPVVYAIGVCCFIQCLVLLADILKIFEGQYE
jgi:TRAP-type C4-dicarboxylate transport system permease small subunit